VSAADLDALAERLREWALDAMDGEDLRRTTLARDLSAAADALEAAAVDVARMDKAEALLAAGGTLQGVEPEAFCDGETGPCVIAEDGDGEQRHVAPTLRAALDAYPEPSGGRDG